MRILRVEAVTSVRRFLLTTGWWLGRRTRDVFTSMTIGVNDVFVTTIIATSM